MTPEQQRIAIAEACGIHVCQSCNHQIDPEVCWCGAPMKNHHYDGHYSVPIGCTCGYADADTRRLAQPDCPDYLNDLNAMHEAEKTLTGQQTVWYITDLMGCCGAATCPVYFATAAIRAEAFLRALNLWKDSP